MRTARLPRERAATAGYPFKRARIGTVVIMRSSDPAAQGRGQVAHGVLQTNSPGHDPAIVIARRLCSIIEKSRGSRHSAVRAGRRRVGSHCGHRGSRRGASCGRGCSGHDRAAEGAVAVIVRPVVQWARCVSEGGRGACVAGGDILHRWRKRWRQRVCVCHELCKKQSSRGRSRKAHSYN